MVFNLGYLVAIVSIAKNTLEPSSRQMSSSLPGCAHFPVVLNIVSDIHANKSHRITEGENLIAVYQDEAQDSGNALARHFCAICGSPLFNTNGDFGRTMAVFYSVLEGFEHRVPEVEYYAKDRVKWLPDFPNTERADTKPGRGEHVDMKQS
jgi:hypothetical protein